MNDMRFPEELVAIHSEMSCIFIRNGTVMINYQTLGYNIFGHIHFIPFWDYVKLEPYHTLSNYQISHFSLELYRILYAKDI